MNPEHVVEIFQRVLKIDELDEHSDFFELGGDSLLATRVLSAIARDFGVELVYDDLVENPSAAALFDLVASVAP
ncbi:acyl carrier protein [Mycolicibacterium sp. 018/SC-01/001]|uniref:phosphopantetheine-binding protein n=1 Tax=Mycolicibacterium sp. 018/SC-01/001 TaxID=2592069 RepID=UPI00117C026F|nr:phosphopantetheine-binding protein [Mycolicibacterium sp. 018/SC-01/001]TRW85391.1 acyl carrier protein [Mycolicibacterium sp. 018/SC-01/001]